MDVRQYRRNWLEQHVPAKEGKILEFGAFDYPTYFKSEAGIEYLDYFSKSELADLHTAAKPERVKNSIEVDHVIKEIDFAEHLTAQFDLLIANHVIEHVPDLIRWLGNASSLLSNSSGRIFLSIPHKEYTFDKVRPFPPCPIFFLLTKGNSRHPLSSRSSKVSTIIGPSAPNMYGSPIQSFRSCLAASDTKPRESRGRLRRRKWKTGVLSMSTAPYLLMSLFSIWWGNWNAQTTHGLRLFIPQMCNAFPMNFTFS